MDLIVFLIGPTGPKTHKETRRRMTLRFTSTSSSSPIEEQRNRVVMSHFYTINTFVSINQYVLNDFVPSPSFPPFVYTDLLSFLETKTLESLKAQAMAMKRNGKSLVSSD